MPFINERLADNQAQLERANQQNALRASRFKFNVEQALAMLQERIIGQADVITAMEAMLYTLKADFHVPHRPLSVSLFLGPTGVGKTETVRVLAEAILGSSEKLCRIDMNTLAQEHYSAALTGSPPGYVGSKEGQTLFNPELIKGNFSEPGIVLFDEIEKADRNVVRALLNVLDTGKLQLTAGTKALDFSNCLIFMTSNLAAKEIAESLKPAKNLWQKWWLKPSTNPAEIIDNALTNHFDPEFINRIDRIVPFNALVTSNLNDIVAIELAKLNQRLKRKNAALTITTEAQQYLTKNYDPRYGARDIARRLRVELEPKVAKALLLNPECPQFEARRLNGELKVDKREG